MGGWWVKLIQMKDEINKSNESNRGWDHTTQCYTLTGGVDEQLGHSGIECGNSCKKIAKHSLKRFGIHGIVVN